ncbi:MAG TPA: glutamate racemase [Fervidobacterium sp.]|nr:glutamate racemase [Fervidobacterium sp.]HOL04076.1 glutamate racemase [Fervidobacterium sp.]HON03541.1 glutamate racemase [Fervidobacterium sp.]HOP82233.1 glutamate racemase [Fervidobacterium sp.]HOS52171.1 glutamate racemase [Fervidobacterium sp.]
MTIGLFDSGVGGLSVLKKLIETLPAHYIYVADTMRAPYGTKNRETIEVFSREIIGFLAEKKVERIFAACNTSDSALVRYRGTFKIPYHSIIEAGVNASKYDRVAVIGTHMTVQSGLYKQELEARGKKVSQRPTQLFVSIVEEGIFYGNMVEAVVKFYLEPFRKFKPQELILGCTHFPFLKDIIARLMDNVRIIDPADEIVREVSHLVGSGRSFVEFYVTGDPEEFERKLKKIGFRHPYQMKHLEISELEQKVVYFERACDSDRVLGSG